MGQHKYNPTAIAAKKGELPPKKRKLSKRESERMDAIRWCELLRGWTICDGNCPVCYALEEGE